MRDLVIGTGPTKTIVSLAEKTLEAILQRAHALRGNRDVDIVEFRLDYLDAALDTTAVAAMAAPVAEAVAGKPLLITFRTKREGGEKEISPAAYAELYRGVLAAGAGDLFDVEAALLEHHAVEIVKAQAQQAGKLVILSHHDFAQTPPVEQMVRLLRDQQAQGADICKLAVMPHNAGDVLRLLEATWTMHSQYADRPILTMAMGGIGAVSRCAGEVFGSALSFGAVGESSAPGQVNVTDLRTAIGITHRALQG